MVESLDKSVSINSYNSEGSYAAPKPTIDGEQINIRKRRDELQGFIVTVGEGSQSIDFYVNNRETFMDKKINEKLLVAYSSIRELNKLIPKKPVRQVIIAEKLSGGSAFAGGPCNMPIVEIGNDSLIPIKSRHETGHMVYQVLLSIPNNDLPFLTNNKHWLGIFLNAQKNKAFNIMDESEYVRTNGGHPGDNPWELFASSINAYISYPDKFSAKVSDPATPEEQRKIGTLIFCYLRDKIFNGKTYCKFDRFEYTHFNDIKKEALNIEKLKPMIAEGIKSKKHGVRVSSIHAIRLFKIHDPELTALVDQYQEEENK